MIEVLETAPLNSVQDLGRVGYRHMGIGRSGAMDRLALAAGNVLLGNDRGAAGVEVQLFPVRFRVLDDVALSITGAACDAFLDGRRLPPWWAFVARAGQELSLGSLSVGMRAYLTMAGGIDVPVVLGSRSTSVRDAFGGFDGRDLRAGDTLRARSSVGFRSRDEAGYGAVPPQAALAAAGCLGAAPGDIVLRVIPAAEYGLFDAKSRAAFWETGWTVTARSNRQGYQLAGVTLKQTEPLEMRSHAIMPGVVQVPPSGQPIIQLADGNSAGGYPKIGVVADADLWRIAQAAPGRVLRFVECGVAAARAAELALDAYIRRLGRLASYMRMEAKPE